MTTPALRFDRVTKRYGAVVAVDDVSLAVDPGEVFALLGLNGAGKTTLIRTLLGMVRPSSGSVEVAGRSLTHPAVWEDVGYLVESPAAYPDLTVRENLEVARRLRGLPAGPAVDSALEAFALGRYAGLRARDLSLGNAQRLGLAKAMLHAPRLLVLDEPVNGLDPSGVAEVRALLAGLAREHGTTVLLSSHLLSEVARLATRIAVLHEGRLVDEFATGDLRSRVRTRLELSTGDDARALSLLRRHGLRPCAADDLLLLDDAWSVDHPAAVASLLCDAGQPPTRLVVVREDLEQYFLRLVAPPRRPEDVPARAGAVRA